MTTLLQIREPGTRAPEPEQPQPAPQPRTVTDPDRTLPISIDAKGDYGFGVILLALALVAIGAVGAWLYLRRTRPPAWQSLPPPESDSEAFERLCDANQLTRKERTVMADVMQGMSGHERLSLFIDLPAFDRASSIVSGADRTQVESIRQKLFSDPHP